MPKKTAILNAVYMIQPVVKTCCPTGCQLTISCKRGLSYRRCYIKNRTKQDTTMSYCRSKAGPGSSIAKYVMILNTAGGRPLSVSPSEPNSKQVPPISRTGFSLTSTAVGFNHAIGYTVPHQRIILNLHLLRNDGQKVMVIWWKVTGMPSPLSEIISGASDRKHSA